MKTKSNLPPFTGRYFALIDREPVILIVGETYAEVIYSDGSKDTLNGDEPIEVWIPVESIIKHEEKRLTPSEMTALDAESLFCVALTKTLNTRQINDVLTAYNDDLKPRADEVLKTLSGKKES